MEEGRSAFKTSAVRPTGKRTLRKFRQRWEDNIRMDLKELRFNMKSWTDLTQK